MKCEKCGNKVPEGFGSGRFCSRQCANSRVFSDESKLKKSKSVIEYYDKKGRVGPKSKKKRYSQMTDEEFLLVDFEELKFKNIRRRLRLEQDDKCNKCNLVEWQGEPIALELEHKDGNNQNNKRENLELLCPNCHAMTKTWRGRNKNTGNKRVSDKELLEALQNSPSIRQALISVGLAGKGSGYSRAKKLMCDKL